MQLETVGFPTASSQNIFDVYVGFTASGYHLGNPERIGDISVRIQSASWDAQTLQYFRFARIDDGRINPYWPRGSILASVALLAEHTEKQMLIEMVSEHLSGMENISPADLDTYVVEWAARLPRYLALVRDCRSYQELWDDYCKIIQDEIIENGPSYTDKVLASRSRLGGLFPEQFFPSHCVTVLNPLQANPLTDIVHVEDHIYIITSHLRPESYIHELIHVLLAPYLADWKERIMQSENLLEPVYEDMVRMAYAWDSSAESWHNVFTETLVRVLTVFAADGEGQAAQLDSLLKQGFIYARPIYDSIVITQALSSEWLAQCLLACEGIASR